MSLRRLSDGLLARLPAAGPPRAPRERSVEEERQYYLRELVAVFLAITVSLYFVGWAAWRVYGLADGAPLHLPMDTPFDRWDVLNYRLIAELGYDAAPHFPAWFPAPAAFMRLSIWLGISPIWGATAAVLACTLGTTIVMYQLVLLDHGPRLSRDATLYLLIFPAAFFLFVPYTEPFLLLTAVTAFYFARRRQWALAGLAAGLASGTRVPGSIVGIGIAVEYAGSIGWDWRRIRPEAGWLLLAPAGLVAFAVYLGFVVDDPLAFYNRVDDIPHLETIAARSGFPGFIPSLIDDVRTIWITESEGELLLNVPGLLGLVFWAAGLLLMVYFRFRLSYVVFSALILVPALQVGRLDALNRYALPAFPIFIALALLFERYPLLRAPYIITSLALFFATGMLFATFRLAG